MALISPRVPSQEQAPEGWRKLWEQAQREDDPKKLRDEAPRARATVVGLTIRPWATRVKDE